MAMVCCPDEVLRKQQVHLNPPAYAHLGPLSLPLPLSSGFQADNLSLLQRVPSPVRRGGCLLSGDSKRFLHKEISFMVQSQKIQPVILIDEVHPLDREMLEELGFLLNFNVDRKALWTWSY